MVKAANKTAVPKSLKNEQNLKDSNILKEFQTFIKSKNIPDKSVNQDVINQFVDYAANTGLIENTVQAKNSASKSVVRASMLLVASAGADIDLTLSAELLMNSLQDDPDDLTFDEDSWETSEVTDCSKYSNLMNSIKDDLDDTSDDYYSASGSITLSSPLDLKLALNKVSYGVAAEYSDGTWTVYVSLHDTYNFEWSDWANISGLSSAAITAVNNYGSMAESTGAVVPYDVNIDDEWEY